MGLKVSKAKKTPIKNPAAGLQERLYQAAAGSVHLVRELQLLIPHPHKAGLTVTQVEEAHELLRASSLGLLSAMAILDGKEDPRTAISEGRQPW